MKGEVSWWFSLETPGAEPSRPQVPARFLHGPFRASRNRTCPAVVSSRDAVKFGNGVPESFEFYEIPLRVESVDDTERKDFSLVGPKETVRHGVGE